MKFLKSLLLCLVAGFALVGCGPKEEGENQNQQQQEQEGRQVEYKDVTDESLKSIAEGHKIYFTTLGQGDLAEADLVLNKKVQVEYTKDNVLEAANVEEGSIVVIVIRWSGKGIAGNITVQTETARVDAFKARAEAGEIKIISLYIGTKQGRGENTDAILDKIVPVSEVFLAVDDGGENSGNFDGKFDTYASSTPVYYSSKSANMTNSLVWMLK